MISSSDNEETIEVSAKPMISSPEWVKHLQQIDESEGFDIDVFPSKCYYKYVDVNVHNKLLDDLIGNYALANYNCDKGTHYKLTEVVKAVVCSICYFITFKAQSKNKLGTFQTKCCVSRNHKRVLFTRLKQWSRVSDMAMSDVSQGVLDHHINFKSQLDSYIQRRGLQKPVYETIMKGSSYYPTFTSTVIVNGVSYNSLTGFFTKNSAEHSAVEVALVQLALTGEKIRCITQPKNYEYTVLPYRKKRANSKVQEPKKKKLRAAACDKHIDMENADGSVVQVSSNEPTNEGCHDVPAEMVPACS